ncbi:Zinc finger protein 470 [Durusdinium trenchii]|uniref:Zinc finger protein 470 n=1 Tax=Durusdinium trenchii TaxID=1381693 RepID=A0ABP0R9K4_9DINO
MASRGTKRPSSGDETRMAKVMSLSTPVAGLPGSINTPVAGLPESTSEAPGSREELQVSRRASFDELKASRQASFDHTGSRSVKGSASPVSEKAEKTGLFVCWLCRRKFDTSEKFDLHVLHSKLHQETIRQLAGLA